MRKRPGAGKYSAMRQTMLALLCALPLAGCAVKGVEGQMQDSIVFWRIHSVPMQQTFDEAEAYCDRRGKAAHYVRTVEIDRYKDRDVFECRPR